MFGSAIKTRSSTRDTWTGDFVQSNWNSTSMCPLVFSWDACWTDGVTLWFQAYQTKVALQRQQELASHEPQLLAGSGPLPLSPHGAHPPLSPLAFSPLGSSSSVSPHKSHKCQHCYKMFPSSQQLGQHMLVHNNVRKYACLYCDKTFKQLSHLQQHHRRHTGRLLPTPHPCDNKKQCSRQLQCEVPCR